MIVFLKSPRKMRWLAIFCLSFMALFFVGCQKAGGGSRGVSVPSIFGGLGPQRYTWKPERSTSGPLLVFVSLPRQEAVVYRNGVRIGRAAVSTGKPGHETPTGVFQILQKDIDHHSRTYGNAPMPYMERLTWDGVALHTGFNPGYSASHGCVRLPDGFARELFKMTHVGGTVVISNSRKLPVMALTDGPGQGGVKGGTWSGLSRNAATSVVVSTSDRRAVVYQNGRQVGSSPVEVRGGMTRFQGEEAFLYAGDQRWHTVEGTDSLGELAKEVLFPDEFRAVLHQIVHPGTTMVVTSEPLGSRGSRSRSVIGQQTSPNPST